MADKDMLMFCDKRYLKEDANPASFSRLLGLRRNKNAVH